MSVRLGKGTISLQFTCLGPDVLKVLSECGVKSQIRYKCLLAKKGESEGREFDLKAESDGSFTFTPSRIEAGAAYEIRVKPVINGSEGEWSDKTELTEEGDGTGACEPIASRQNKEEREVIEGC